MLTARACVDALLLVGSGSRSSGSQSGSAKSVVPSTAGQRDHQAVALRGRRRRPTARPLSGNRTRDAIGAPVPSARARRSGLALQPLRLGSAPSRPSIGVRIVNRTPSKCHLAAKCSMAPTSASPDRQRHSPMSSLSGSGALTRLLITRFGPARILRPSSWPNRPDGSLLTCRQHVPGPVTHHRRRTL